MKALTDEQRTHVAALERSQDELKDRLVKAFIRQEQTEKEIKDLRSAEKVFIGLIEEFNHEPR